jgi:hypothetical protein
MRVPQDPMSLLDVGRVVDLVCPTHAWPKHGTPTDTIADLVHHLGDPGVEVAQDALPGQGRVGRRPSEPVAQRVLIETNQEIK